MSDEQRIGDLQRRLLNVSRAMEERQLANELKERLGSAAFRAALSVEIVSENGRSNWWTELLKAVMIKLTSGEHKSTVPEFLAALSRLVEKAEQCGALFVGETPHLVVELILGTLYDEDSAHAKLYWSVLSSLSSQPEYFRAVGREEAQRRCKELADFAWSALLPANDSDGTERRTGRDGVGRPAMCDSASRLLTRLLINFPYALPELSMADFFAKLTKLIERCTPP